MPDHCPICLSRDAEPVFRRTVPLLSLIAADTPVDATLFRPFELLRCRACGHLRNGAFTPDLPDLMYGDTPLSNVPVHVSMVQGLRDIADWIGADARLGRRVLEIGSGSGHMARILARDAAEVTVFEPCRGLTPAMLPESNIRLFNTVFPAPGHDAGRVDLVVCRHVVEHVDDPALLLTAIRGALAEGGRAYLETPSAEYIAAFAALPDLHLQHVQYFTLPGLIALAARCGLAAERWLPIKDGHDFGVMFRADAPREVPAAALLPAAGSLGRRLARQAETARRRLAALPGPVALYGANTHAQSFANIAPDQPFAACFDDNDGYGGLALYNRAGAIPVSKPLPERLRDAAAVIVTTYLHDRTIAGKLRAAGYAGRILTARPEGAPADESGLEGIFE